MNNFIVIRNSRFVNIMQTQNPLLWTYAILLSYMRKPFHIWNKITYYEYNKICLCICSSEYVHVNFNDVTWALIKSLPLL